MELVLEPGSVGGIATIAGLLAAAMAGAWLTGAAWARRTMRGAALAAAPAPAPAPAPREEAPAAATPLPPPPSPSACQQRALEERRAVFARPVALAELAAEVAAIRRDERVFRTARNDEELLVLPSGADAPRCRFLGLSGQPTCPASPDHSCTRGTCCPGFVPLAQPRPIQRAGEGRSLGAGSY